MSAKKAALALAKKGNPVFPCKARGEKAKAPFTKNGLKDATTDPDQIKAWWSRNKNAAIGLATGHKYDVLDVDVKEKVDGRGHLSYLTRLGLLDGCVRVVRTPSGGWHLYFLSDPGLTNKARAGLGLDVRAKGGYVLAAPSYIDTGEYAGVYEDFGKPEGGTPGHLMWDLICSALEPMNLTTQKPVAILPSERRHSLAALREWVSVREPGERNNALHWAVCRCIDDGMDPRELIEPALLSGLTEHEITLTIGSALKRAGIRADDLQTEAEVMFPTLG